MIGALQQSFLAVRKFRNFTVPLELLETVRKKSDHSAPAGIWKGSDTKKGIFSAQQHADRGTFKVMTRLWNTHGGEARDLK